MIMYLTGNADDTIMYLTVSKESDCQALQTDLSNLEQGEIESFNPDKCEVIRFIKKIKPNIFEYKLCCKILESATSAKYQGVTVSQDSSWAAHNKTSNTLNGSHGSQQNKQHTKIY